MEPIDRFDLARGRLSVIGLEARRSAAGEVISPAPRAAKPDLYTTRPDPSIMYAPRESWIEPRPPMRQREPGAPTRGSRVSLETRWRRFERFLPKPLADYGLGLCRAIDPNHAAEIWAAFLDALELVSRRATAAPEHPEHDWFRRPYYALEPARYFERLRDRPDLDRGFAWIRALGFENVLLLGPVPDDGALDRARARGLRLVATLDLDRGSPMRVPWLLGHDPTGLGMIRRALADLSAHARLGILGEHLHHVDRWALAVAPRAGGTLAIHGMVALLKLFLQLANDSSVVLADYDLEREAVGSLVGGRLPIDALDGRVRPRESDLVIWWKGSSLVREAILDRDRGELEQLFAHVPAIGFGAALGVTLDDHDSTGRRFADLVDGDARRIGLALAIQFMLPAIPIVQAGIEAAARGTHLLESRFRRTSWAPHAPTSILRAMNAIYARHRFNGPLRARTIEVGSRSLACWSLGRLLGIFNLDARPQDAHIDARVIDRAFGADVEALSPLLESDAPLSRLRIARERRASVALGPHGFRILLAGAAGASNRRERSDAQGS
jgi:hypothetical protein